MNKNLAAWLLACANLAPLAAQCAAFYVAPRGDDLSADSHAAPCISQSADGQALALGHLRNNLGYKGRLVIHADGLDMAHNSWTLPVPGRDAPRQADGSLPFKGAAPDMGGFSAP